MEPTNPFGNAGGRHTSLDPLARVTTGERGVMFCFPPFSQSLDSMLVKRTSLFTLQQLQTHLSERTSRETYFENHTPEGSAMLPSIPNPLQSVSTVHSMLFPK